jgi:uncharacterized membrane protein YdbT with pleckstrin-like domain
MKENFLSIRYIFISMNEISKILEANEKVVYEGKPEYAPYIAAAALSFLFGIAFIEIFLVVFIKSVLLAVVIGITVFILGIVLSNMVYAQVFYVITDKRAIIQTGLIGRDFKSIDYDRMQNISVDVGALGVIFKVGSVNIFTGEIETVGGKNPRIEAKYDTFAYVASPYDVLKKLQTYLSMRKEKLA